MELAMGSWLRRGQRWGVGALTIALIPAVAIAQEANFGKLALNAGKLSGSMSGSTGGSTSLPAIVGSVDRHNNKCLGFGDPKPDHLLILQQPFSSLSIRVRSAPQVDTTLVVQSPDGSLRCGDDSGSQKDALVSDNNWQPGTYRVWVGTTNPRTQSDYTLLVRP